MKHLVLIAVAAVLLAIAPTSAAVASENNDMQVRIDAVLHAHPGGTQIAWNEVSWDDGDVVLTLASEAPVEVSPLAAVGNCASGTFCAYTDTSYRGDKLTFSACTNINSVSALGGTVRSMANSRGSGSIKAYSSTVLLATAVAGTGTNVSGTTVYINCS